MMRKNIWFWGMIGSMLLLAGCSKDENNEVDPSDLDRDWFVVQDLPGEYNQARYALYRDEGITILSSDTLGQEERGVDGYGRPVIHTEVYNPIYSVYNDFKGVYTYRCSQDTVALLKAMAVVSKWVCPYLPTEKTARPRVIFLADSLFWNGKLGIAQTSKFSISVCSDAFHGVPVGGIEEYRDLGVDALEWRRVAGLILALEARDWMQDNREDELKAWWDLSPKDMGQAIYTIGKFTDKCTDGQTFFYWNGKTPHDLGLFRWEMEGPVMQLKKVWVNGKWEDRIVPHTGGKAPSQSQDVIEYVANYYAYLGRESEFAETYKEFPLIVKKMDVLRPLIQAYEKAVGVVHNK